MGGRSSVFWSPGAGIALGLDQAVNLRASQTKCGKLSNSIGADTFENSVLPKVQAFTIEVPGGMTLCLVELRHHPPIESGLAVQAVCNKPVAPMTRRTSL